MELPDEIAVPLEVQSPDQVSLPTEEPAEQPGDLLAEASDAELEPPVEQVSEPETLEEMPAPPDWVLAGDEPEDERIPDEGYEWLPSEAEEELAQPAADLLDLNQASLIQLERLPGVGFRRAQAIVAHRDQHGEFSSLDELLEVPGMDNDTYETLIARLYIQVRQTPEPAQPAERPDTGALPSLPRQQVAAEDEDHQRQLKAQEMMGQGELENALEEYLALIKRGRRLEDIIEDLNQALYYAPAEASVSILQTLGDAYLKAGQLQDALEAYTKAEQQLR
jgi:competence protein ComEA